MPFTTSTFSVSVTLTKLVHRQGSVAGQSRTPIDLTPLFGPAGSIRIAKNVRDPSGTGGFTLAFADRISASAFDSYYALIEPMDMIEIRASRTVLGGAKPPLIMRGFVSTVVRERAIGANGEPARMVVVRGQDSGKLIQQIQIAWEYAAATGEPYLAQFAPLATNGIPTTETPVSAFMQAIVSQVINPKVQALNIFSSVQIQPFSCRATVPEGDVVPTGLNPQGSIWGIMLQAADVGTWNELFVQDSEAGPIVVFRPVPFRDIIAGDGGTFLMPGAVDPGSIEIYDTDIMRISTERSDAGVSNFFWVDPGQNLINTNFGTAVGNLTQGADFPSSPANDIALYGLRILRKGTGLVGSAADQSTVPYQTDPTPLEGPAAFVQTRIQELRALNQNNVLFEAGSMQVRGSELLVPGQYIDVTEGTVSWSAYLYAVEHNIVPLGMWTAGLAFDRSDGFYKRDRSALGWGWAEGRSGPYSPPRALQVG